MQSEPAVFVVDDDCAVRESLQMLLESAGWAVRAFASAEEFLDAYDGEEPGCLVLDVKMPGMSGLELQREMARRGDLLPIIMVTAYGSVPSAVRAVQAGAVDFIEKPFAHERLFHLIRKAIGKDREKRQQARERVALLELGEKLTRRETEVMHGLMAGQSNKQIAAELGLSPRTVEVHRARVMRKMGAQSLPELVQLGLKLAAASAGTAPRPRRA